MGCTSNLTEVLTNSVYRENLNRGYGRVLDVCNNYWTKIDPNDPIGVINVKASPYGAIGDGAPHPLSGLYLTLALAQVDYPSAIALTDELDTVAIQKAITNNVGKMIYMPTGGYRINRKISFVSTDTINFLTASLRLCGDGLGNTVLLNAVANDFCISIDTTTNLHFQHNPTLRDFAITAQGVPAASSGIEIKKAYLANLENLHIHGLTGTGIKVVCTAGDQDAPVQVNFNKVYVTDCAGWGMNFTATDGTSGAANITVENVYVARCGTFGVSDSGGVKWHGTMFRGINWDITVCENHGLWLAPNTTVGQSNCFITENLDLEHNKLKSLEIESCSCFHSIHTQILNNPAVSPNATHGVYIDGNAANKLVQGVTFINTEVRVTTLNFTAFEAIGANVNTINVKDTQWDTFDLSGQKRFVDNGVNQFHIDDSGIEWPRGEAIINVALGSFNFTADAATDFLTSAAHNLLNGDVVRFTTTVTLPAPLLAGVDYVVINKTANTWQLTVSVTGNPISAGTPIDITSAGAGVHSIANSYAPDIRRYKIFRIKCVTGGGAAYVCATPVTAPLPGATVTGRHIIVDFQNSSAGAIAVTFGGLITQTGYTNPGAGGHRSSGFYYNNLDGLNQIGAWSA